MNKVKRKKSSIISRIGDFMNNKIQKYKELPSKTRSIITLWIVLVLFIVLIIIVCNINNKKLVRYENAEKDMAKAAVKYAEDKKLAGIDSQKIKLDMSALINSNYLNVDEKIEADCIGYALVFTNRDDEVKASGYLSCKGYATEGFSFK